MGKYLSFKFAYNEMPGCNNNFEKALLRIGEKDPLNVKKYKMCGRMTRENDVLTRNDYIKRGILNVRKTLNGHLGHSGKYKNRMISLSSKVNIIKKEDDLYLKSKISYKEYKKIVKTVFDLLYKCDPAYCDELIKVERKDAFPMKELNHRRSFRTIAPIQSNMIIRTINGQTDIIRKYCEDVSSYLARGNYYV